MSRGSRVFSNKKKPRYEWTVNCNQTITSSLAILKDSVVYGTQEGQIHCVNKQGLTRWTYDASPHLSAKEQLFVDAQEVSSIFCTPLVFQDHLFFGTESGEIHCLDSSGKLVWKQKVDGAIRATPHIIKSNDESMLVIGTIDGSLYFCNLHGKILKIIKVKSPISTSIVEVNNVLYFGCDDGKVIACNEKGLHLWTYETHGKITANMVLGELFSDGVKSLIIGSQDNNLYVLSLDGELQWKFATKGAIISAPTLVHLSSQESKDILVGSCDNKVYCVSAHGEELWSYETDFWVTATPSIVERNGLNKICIGSYDQKFYVLDGESDFQLSYMPGLSGIINQTGYTSLTTSRDVGENTAKKLFEQEVQGHVISCTAIPNTSRVVITTKQGHIYEFSI